MENQFAGRDRLCAEPFLLRVRPIAPVDPVRLTHICHLAYPSMQFLVITHLVFFLRLADRLAVRPNDSQGPSYETFFVLGSHSIAKWRLERNLIAERLLTAAPGPELLTILVRYPPGLPTTAAGIRGHSAESSVQSPLPAPF